MIYLTLLDGKLWQFFSHNPFKLTILTRKGNPSISVTIKGELKARYIESLSYDQNEMAIGVVILENNI